jgi:hypothetical protein
MTQREFRRRRGEKWSPSFISKFGKLASKLYREVYKKEPPYKLYRELYKTDLPYGANGADFEPINLYPYGILVQAYRRLIAAGEQIGEPYREPDPDLKPKEPVKPVYRTEIARRWGNLYEKGGPVWNGLVRKVAERVAAAAAGKLTNEDADGEDIDGEDFDGED